VKAVAERKGVTPAQLALAWVLRIGPDVAPIPGTTKPERLEENLGALEVTLDDADLAELDAAAPVGAAVGSRYPEPQMAVLGR
jgi:aryl-alcohol dehydrogenase-like predicted oxidoreductase